MEKRIVKAKTKDGFKCDIDLNIVEDYRFLRVLKEASEDGTKYVDMVQMLIGKDGEEKLIEHILKKGNNPSVELMGEYISEIILSCKETKN